MWNILKHNHKNWPSTYLALTPRTSKSEVYADSFAVMTYMDCKEIEQWKDSFNTVGNESPRGVTYEDFKSRKAELLLKELYNKFPQLRGNIMNVHTSTPLSFRDYIGGPSGSLYGFERNYQDPMRTALAVQTRIPNLSLTGQNINVHGILGVTVSGILTCLNFLDRKKLLTDIVSA
jgi:all-trans-retinol 13,14-reductase